MRLSFKPNSIALPEPNPFFKNNSSNSSPSIKFQRETLENQSNHQENEKVLQGAKRSFPKTPHPDKSDNPMEKALIESKDLIVESPSIPEQISNQLTELCCEQLSSLIPLSDHLIIDIRPSIQFTKSHIKPSINVFVPTSTLRSTSFDLKTIQDCITNATHKQKFSLWASYKAIVFVDSSSTILSNSSPIVALSNKLFEIDSSKQIFWAKGGFKEFQLNFTSQIEVCKGPLIASGTKKPSLSLKALGPLTCFTPASEGLNNQFFNSLRQYNTASSTCSETIPICLPSSDPLYSKPNCSSELPLFLRKMLEANHGEKAMAEAFQRLDVSEQNRLKSLAKITNVSHKNPYCVSAGIEKGHKNRFISIWPYENSRIKLNEHLPTETDYINASLIKEPITNKQYIATQGPLPSTFGDFYQLTWQSNSRLIVMLTKEFEGGRIRCDRYWPDSPGQTKTYGNFKVKLLQEATCSNTGLIVIRKLLVMNVNKPGEPRVLVQLHFTGWPDFGVPDEPTTLLRVRNLARHLQTLAETSFPETGPMVVHCSAGCGRTGAFCTIDSSIFALDSGKASNYPDIVYSIVDHFRDQRISMVQTHRQLVLCYESLIWYLISDKRCGELSGLCGNLRALDFACSDSFTPYKDKEVDSYFSPMATSGASDYFSFSPRNLSTLVSTTPQDGFPF